MITIMLVGDIVDESGGLDVLTVFDNDNPHQEEVDALAEWLREAGYGVIVNASVQRFVDSPPHRGETVVFPLWRGGSSRNRTAIVPAICEERRLPYIGGDAFTQCVCQNKSLSKIWAHVAGFSVPRENILYSPKEASGWQPVSNFGSPCVVKPLSSACSIGVTDASLCICDEEAVTQAKRLFASDLGPVLCEEYVTGEEVAICVIERDGQITQRCVVGYRDASGRCPFYDRLFTFEDKLEENPPWKLEVLNRSVNWEIWKSAETMIRWLGRVDYMRFDGRIKDGQFVLVELTPDIHLALSSSFLGGFSAMGMPPPQLLDNLIRTSLCNQGCITE